MSNNSSTGDRTDLRLGQSPYLFMVFDFYFDGVTVKTGNMSMRAIRASVNENKESNPRFLTGKDFNKLEKSECHFSVVFHLQINVVHFRISFIWLLVSVTLKLSVVTQ